jgi:hypothetical protein
MGFKALPCSAFFASCWPAGQLRSWGPAEVQARFGWWSFQTGHHGCIRLTDWGRSSHHRPIHLPRQGWPAQWHRPLRRPSSRQRQSISLPTAAEGILERAYTSVNRRYRHLRALTLKPMICVTTVQGFLHRHHELSNADATIPVHVDEMDSLVEAWQPGHTPGPSRPLKILSPSDLARNTIARLVSARSHFVA